MSDVSTPSNAYARGALKWDLARTLMGGTAAMRAAGEKYLPKEPAESDECYKSRVARSTLFNAFRKTVRDMTGKVFRMPVVLGDDVPAAIKTYAENIDAAGRHINVFARDVFADGLQTGIAFILADMPPKVTRPDGQPATLQDEANAGIRPYLCLVKCENLIGWKSERVGGNETLTQIRIREWVTEPDGEFGEKDIEQIKVLEPGKWATYRKKRSAEGKEEWVKYEEGTTNIKRIPIAPVYINRTEFMSGEPPLEDLADLNVAHWQSQSDQRNILHVARVPILFGAGWSDEDKLVIGAGNMVRNSKDTAKLSYTEHSGAAIGAGDKDLQNLEFQMQTQGLQLLIPQPGGKTATGEVRDEAKENSPLAMMAFALQDGLEQALGFMAEYMVLGKDTGGSVKVNTDFGVSLGGTEVHDLLDMVNSGQITKETFWSELQRRGFLNEDFDAEVEKDKLASEAPVMDAGPGKGMNLNGGGGKPAAAAA